MGLPIHNTDNPMIGTRLGPYEISVSIGVLYQETLYHCSGVELFIGASDKAACTDCNSSAAASWTES